MTALSRAQFAGLRDGIHDESFAPQSDPSRRVGAEVEFLVVDESTKLPVPIHSSGGSIERLRSYGLRAGWREFRGYDGTPRFDAGGQATMSFEPGGQLEISSKPFDSASELIRALRRIVAPLRSALNDQGIALLAVGIDPLNDVAHAPLQLQVARYERMTRYFDRIGPFGVRMMRQTAALQLSLDRGARPAERWRLLNDLAPYLVAIFANSPHYLGIETGDRSYRARCWRMLDSSRTGISTPDEDPAGAYTTFALGAYDMLSATADEAHQPFAASLQSGASAERWAAHLTTLFPEVRPRGHFEVRSCDTIEPAHYAAPIVFLSGITYDQHSSNEASLLAAESRALLRTAGELGLRDAAIARTARDLFELGLSGARRLGTRYVDGRDLEIAQQFYLDYTARERSPADDRSLPIGPSALSATVRSLD
jgi:glutamate--cysteine ligase